MSMCCHQIFICRYNILSSIQAGKNVIHGRLFSTHNLNNNLDNLVEEETETPDNAQPQAENKDEPVDQSASLPETELKATPTAARWPNDLPCALSSSRLGLTSARAGGSAVAH